MFRLCSRPWVVNTSERIMLLPASSRACTRAQSRHNAAQGKCLNPVDAAIDPLGFQLSREFGELLLNPVPLLNRRSRRVRRRDFAGLSRRRSSHGGDRGRGGHRRVEFAGGDSLLTIV